MYELIQAAENTFYIQCPAKIGVYRADGGRVYIIDSGNDKEAGKRVERILNERGWTPAAIINTHSNADHVGGNRVLMERMGCKAYCYGIEAAFTRHPILEPSFLYGGYPCKKLQNKFLMAPESDAADIRELSLPSGMEYFPLKGHFFDMIGVRTPDGVVFLSDCLFGQNAIEKYHICFIYDVGEFIRTLESVAQMTARLFVPAHAEATADIKPLVRMNLDKVQEIIERLLLLCRTPLCFEDILQKAFEAYGLSMNFSQYVLVGSTVRSYLSYLYDRDLLKADFVDSRLLWSSAG